MKLALGMILLGMLFLGGCSAPNDSNNGLPVRPVVDSECGNGVCEQGETNELCAADCASLPNRPVCGNYACEPGETSDTCYSDCDSPSPGPNSGCSSDSDCGYKQICSNRECVSVDCTSDSQCSGCKRCSDNSCVSCGSGPYGCYC